MPFYYEYTMSISEIKDSIYIIKNIIDYDKCKQIVNFITENKTLHQYIEVNSLKKNNVECSFINMNDNMTI